MRKVRQKLDIFGCVRVLKYESRLSAEVEADNRLSAFQDVRIPAARRDLLDQGHLFGGLEPGAG